MNLIFYFTVLLALLNNAIWCQELPIKKVIKYYLIINFIKTIMFLCNIRCELVAILQYDFFPTGSMSKRALRRLSTSTLFDHHTHHCTSKCIL